MSQGGNANINGARLEKRVELLFDQYNVDYTKQHGYKSIYDHNAKMDFYIPALDTAIECKNQEGSGTDATDYAWFVWDTTGSIAPGVHFVAPPTTEQAKRDNAACKAALQK